MSGQSVPSRLQDLFEAALNDYEKKTGIALDKHPVGIGGERGRSERGESAYASPRTIHFLSICFARTHITDHARPILRLSQVRCPMQRTPQIHYFSYINFIHMMLQ